MSRIRQSAVSARRSAGNAVWQFAADSAVTVFETSRRRRTRRDILAYVYA